MLGTASVIRAFVPGMVAARRGHDVFTSSITGLAPLSGGENGAYSASKHAIVGTAETLRVELDEVAPQIGVTVLCPGPVPTGIHQASRNRPPELSGAEPVTTLPTPSCAVGHVMATVSAQQTATDVIVAIEAHRMYLLPGSGTALLARARIGRLMAELPDA